MKNRIKKISIYIVMTLLFISCTNGEHPVTSRILASKSLQLKQDLSFEIIDAHDFELLSLEDMNTKIKDICYIPFYSKEPIGIFDELIIYDNHVIVLDAFNSEKIYIFDISGKLIHIIDNKGGGPEEYHGLMDISVSRKDTLIAIPDRLSLNMLYYSLDGHFIKKTKTVPCFYLEAFGDKIVNQTTFAQSYSQDIEQNYNLTISSKDSVIYKGFPYFPIQKEAVNGNGLQYNYEGKLLFTPVLCDTVY
ncbi:MAG: 6-bladed beta-propeller [Dysgonamonadaceae bacterium]|nr:6-bladed beta-propeller [Dysgonamonadaceae bacterium]